MVVVLTLVYFLIYEAKLNDQINTPAFKRYGIVTAVYYCTVLSSLTITTTIFVTIANGQGDDHSLKSDA